MSTVSAFDDQAEAPLFGDGLGDRTVTADGATGELLQILHIKPSLTSVPSFEFALRERSARLANFRHASYARVRRIDRTMHPDSALAIISDHIEGTRLSELLRVAHERGLSLDINASLCLIRQLVPAVALLHENARDAAHGLLAPERLVVTPQGRLVIVEHVLGAAVEQLQYGRDRLWQDFRVGMPATAGLPRFDHRSDVAGIGLVALALVLGRPLGRDEYPHQVSTLLDRARARTSPGIEQPLSEGMRGWISRALQLEVRRAFASASEAASALEEVLASDGLYVAAPVALETFLSRYAMSLLEPVAPPPPIPPPVRSDWLSDETAGAPSSSWIDTPAPVSEWTDKPAAAAASEWADEPATSSTSGWADEPALVASATRIERMPRATPTPIAQAPTAPVPVAYAPVAPVPVAPAPVAARVPLAAPPPQEPVRAIPPAANITDLIPVDDLTRLDTMTSDPAPLFNPDSPFTATIPVMPTPPARRTPSRRIIGIVALLLALCGGGYAAMKMLGNRPAALAAPGTLIVQSNPSGVPVFVDGIEHGVTPARITLQAGSHILELRRGVPRVIPLNITAGAEVSQYLEFAEAPVVGYLVIQSDPAGAKVLIDGVERGVSPLTISDLAPGEHQVVLQSETSTAKHTVVVQAGSTASLMVPMAGGVSSGPVSGWISLKAPFRIQIFEQGQLLGTTDADRLMLAAGRHELELVNEALGYRVTRVVQVPAGRVMPLTVELPRGVVSLNATPWAEVWIDGERAGETPLGNLSVPIGSHEVVFRHPQLGEKRHAISVTLNAPVRLSVDMK